MGKQEELMDLHELIVLETLRTCEDINVTTEEIRKPTGNLMETIFYNVGMVYPECEAIVTIDLKPNQKLPGMLLLSLDFGTSIMYCNFDHNTKLWGYVEWIIEKAISHSKSKDNKFSCRKLFAKDKKKKKQDKTLQLPFKMDAEKKKAKIITKSYSVKGAYQGKPNVKEFEQIDSPEKHVIFSRLAFEKVFAAVDKYAKENKEIGFYPQIVKNSDTEYYVEDVEIPAQTIQSAYFEVPAGEIFKVPNPEKVRGLIHSHHSMGVFFSGNDEQTMKQGAAECGKNNFYISIIVNSARNAVAKLFERSVGKIEKIKVMYEINESIEAWLEERDKEVTRYVYVAPATNHHHVHSSYSYYEGWGYDDNDYVYTSCSICMAKNDLIKMADDHICLKCLSNLMLLPELVFSDPEKFYEMFPTNKFIDDSNPDMPIFTTSFLDANDALAELSLRCTQNYSLHTSPCKCEICSQADTSKVDDYLYVSDYSFKSVMRKYEPTREMAEAIPLSIYWKKCFNEILKMIDGKYTKISFEEVLNSISEQPNETDTTEATETELTPTDSIDGLTDESVVEDINQKEE